MDDVELTFSDEALKAIAEKSFERKTGARGLRAILEKVLMEPMFHVPDDETIKSVGITKDVIEKDSKPVMKHFTDIELNEGKKKVEQAEKKVAGK